MTQKLPHGYDHSSLLEQSLMDTLMNEALQMSTPQTSVATPSAISSPVLEAGPTPSSSQDGPQIVPCGPEAAPASHSQQPGKDSPKPTNGTSGLCSSISSASATLSRSLGSRLRQRLATAGSMEYRQTWKQRATPAGRPYWAHTASALRTSGNDSIGWPTPTTRDHKDGTAKSCENTPINALLGRAVHLTGWCSPTVTDADRGVLPPRPQDTGIPLTQQIAGLTGWATPMAATNNPQAHGSSNTDFQREVETAFGLRESKNSPKVSGLTSSSSTAETEKPAAYQLNPHFSRWLMGFPPEWCDCAVTAMQSFPSVRKSSSKRS